MKFTQYPFLLLVVAAMIACRGKTEELNKLSGQWEARLDIGQDNLPFGLGFAYSGEKWVMEVYNGEEILTYDEVEILGDSLKITMGIFDSEIKAKFISKDKLEGIFVKNTSTDYRIPFQANRSKGNTRFEVTKQPTTDFSGKWKTVFEKTNGDQYDALAIFTQQGDKLTGTFLTELGDYRFLEGNVNGNAFQLSAFDGSHLFLFKGELNEHGTISGGFRSGPKVRESFQSVRDKAFELSDSYSLNYLKEGYDKLSFTFPDVYGNQISIDDEKFKDKVVLVQIFGTWCPNCMDETKFLAPWYEKNKERGVEIIGLAFESKPEFDYASSRVKKSIDKLGAGYTFLIAGVSNKEKASKALPALNKVIAFPTLIYIGKKGTVRHIHTGFNGPGTGEYYTQWVDEHEKLVRGLLEE